MYQVNASLARMYVLPVSVTWPTVGPWLPYGQGPWSPAFRCAARIRRPQVPHREAGQGTLREAVTRSSGGYVAIYALGASAVLVLLGDEGLDITRLHRESRAVVDNIEKLLT